MTKKLVLLATAALLALAMAGVVSARTSSAAPSTLSVKARFYSDYEALTVHYHLGRDYSCVKDQYGFYDNTDCDDIDSQDATYDIHVTQTYPRHRKVYAEREFGFSGHDTDELYWDIDLKAPFCFDNSYQRRYVATVRLFSPVTDRVVKSRTVRFAVKCN